MWNSCKGKSAIDTIDGKEGKRGKARAWTPVANTQWAEAKALSNCSNAPQCLQLVCSTPATTAALRAMKFLSFVLCALCLSVCLCVYLPVCVSSVLQLLPFPFATAFAVVVSPFSRQHFNFNLLTETQNAETNEEQEASDERQIMSDVTRNNAANQNTEVSDEARRFLMRLPGADAASPDCTTSRRRRRWHQLVSFWAAAASGNKRHKAGETGGLLKPSSKIAESVTKSYKMLN